MGLLFCDSYGITFAIGKDKNLFINPPAMDEIVRQTTLSRLGCATSIGEGKLKKKCLFSVHCFQPFIPCYWVQALPIHGRCGWRLYNPCFTL